MSLNITNNENTPADASQPVQKKNQNTIVMPSKDDKKVYVRSILDEVYKALTVKGYDPVLQIVGYIMSGDPTYITSYNSARSLICKIERDELLSVVVDEYLTNGKK
ncbi:MAG: IreB family regulatory phosphoprotein [Clostridia bacterium]|nr:IreB family regulatory phosphoprotein [Clostridia bacterium]